jgi:hypothetical protein
VRVKGSRARWIPSPAPPEAPSRKGMTSQSYSLHPLWALLTVGGMSGCETPHHRGEDHQEDHYGRHLGQA